MLAPRKLLGQLSIKMRVRVDWIKEADMGERVHQFLAIAATILAMVKTKRLNLCQHLFTVVDAFLPPQLSLPSTSWIPMWTWKAVSVQIRRAFGLLCVIFPYYSREWTYNCWHIVDVGAWLWNGGRTYHAFWTFVDRPSYLTPLLTLLPALGLWERTTMPMSCASRISLTLHSMPAHMVATEMLLWTSDSLHLQLSVLDWNHTCVNCSCCFDPTLNSRWILFRYFVLKLTPSMPSTHLISFFFLIILITHLEHISTTGTC